ncbi:acetylxylan esterase [Paenibacillus sp. LHD-117]|uniref:acetylxylan esterase n=1 Tax=Paenibacillus sp. LHD-117 TaxID=3071412 RepID=UPI0027E1A9B5|nr:acetylxylan esterase [Paenibacillus sp. LHD-117]MDQ6419444.1 acetylxylan esterase [Paenibacillus sp. LHD-117]
MGYIEETTKHLYHYLPELTRKDDFFDFWRMTLEQARAVPLRPERTAVDYPIRSVRVYDIAYNGMDETRISGWLILPSFQGKAKVPCLIHYHGFTGSRGNPSNFMHWVMMGMAVLAVDCRDQGGKTGNSAHYTHGFMGNVASKGVHDKHEYYYRYAYMDCLKAIDFACAQDDIDAERIVIEGGSQGGALGMAVAALDDRAKLAMVDVPSNSNIVARIEGNHGAFGAVTEYLRRHPEQTDLVMDNLSYFDTMNMAERIECPVLASVALKDETCPPLMYFASYNRIRGEKEIVVYPFNGHEGGGSKQTEVKLSYMQGRFPDWFDGR